MKKPLCALAALLILIVLGAGPSFAEAYENVIRNGDFSEVEDGFPAFWQKDMWRTENGVSALSLEGDGHEGSAGFVENKEENDARFAQTVAVEPSSVYRLSGWIRAEDCGEEGRGANLSFDGLSCYTDPQYDTDGEWVYVELYGRTGESQTEATVFARVGGYSATTTGRAWFDDIEMVRLDEAPTDAVIYNLYRASAPAKATSDADEEPTRHTEALLLFTCIYAIVVMGLVRKRGRTELSGDKGIWTAEFVAGLVIAFLVRAIFAMRIRGYSVDVTDFSLWSERMFAQGPTHFYNPDAWCDYPPGYMLMLWPVAALRRLLGLEMDSALYLLLLKLLPILFDLGGAALVWRVAREKHGERAAVALGLLMAFNPAAIANSAAWGQIDAVLTLLIALCALTAMDGRYIASMVWFGLALLIKPQALLFAPLGLAAIVFQIVRSREEAGKRVLRLATGVVACLALLYAVAFLCCLGQAEGALDALARPVKWLFELYGGTMQSYAYVTVNTLNLYYLFGLNWAKMESHHTIGVVAWALFALSYVFTIVLTGASAKKPRRLFLTGGVLMLLICTFGPMMHERYIYPALLLLALAYACERDRRVLISVVALSCTLFLNQALVLQGGVVQAKYGHLQDSERWLNDIVSCVNVLNALFASWTAFDICVFDHVRVMRTLPPEATPAGAYTLAQPADYKLNLKRLDVLLMAAVTLAYSVLAFVNLGDLKAPQTGWVSSAAGESVVFDLGEVRTYRMTYYGGICKSHFGVELSNDGEQWSEKVWGMYDDGQVFRWIWFRANDNQAKPNQSVLYNETVPTEDGSAYIVYPEGGNDYPMQTSRYVRITAEEENLTMFEFGFLDEDGVPLPINGISQSGQAGDNATSAALLIDEQNTIPAYPSYLNSTYFDEIYHARTAYEQLHDINAFEWSHPPLGKALMELGIVIFGMTPFGWRFMGTLMGVLMLPLMYLLVKQLTKDSRLSFIAMCLMALDAMHFTQTRIATIDSYAVFWIMLMYLFMFRYCQMSWNRESFGRTLIPLGLCGVTMGIAWATKWIGIYASAGLAILFFWTIFRRIREGMAMGETGEAVKKTCLTGLFCLVFFVLIPVTIYYMSYFFQLQGDNVARVDRLSDMFTSQVFDRVVKLQQSIFNYHAGLGGDTHYFRSPWYQWPIIWWPMWYYSGTTYMPEGVISSISCMGNPAVWWFGLVALIFVILRLSWLRRAPKRYLMVVVGFASQFLPWVIVPRSMFIYHYFASVPFIIMATALFLQWIRGKNKTAYIVTTSVLLAAALVLFVMFYPLESGLPVSRAYAMHLRWFKWYNF